MLGNPPYNAVQVSFNDANPADKYPDIDAKIAETYIENSTVGNKDKQYDMYKRFLKWASERIKNNGMVVFVSNNSFLDAKSDDGFRRSVFEEFDYIYTVNLKGNARLSGEAWRLEGGKIFGQGARVGVAISVFMKTGENNSEIQYAEIDDCVSRENKLKWLEDNSLSTLPLRQIEPDKDAIWLNQTDNDFDELVPIVSDNENSIFRMLSMGLASNRNEWVYDFDQSNLEKKMKYFVDFYNKTLEKYNHEKPTTDLKDFVDKKIKWDRELIKHLKRGKKLTYSKTMIKNTLYRPFVQKSNYFDSMIISWPRKFPIIFRNSNSNKLICFPNPKTNVLFQSLSSNRIIDLDCVTGTQCIPIHTYDDHDRVHSNITEFGLEMFRTHYKDSQITDEDIFYYTYAIFNDPKYLAKYKFNLQRRFPRIPLAKNCRDWIKIGRKLYDMHVKFESAQPCQLKRIDKKTNNVEIKLQLKKRKKKCVETLPCDSEDKIIIIDNKTTLEGIPSEALEYKFSSKCALEWILEFYKESKNTISDKSCDDPKIQEKFNTYKFSDHKEHVIDLLQKVTTISVETMKIRKKLEKMPWGSQLKFKKYFKDDKKEVKTTESKPKSKKPKKPRTKRTRKDRLQRTHDGTGQKRLF